MSGTGAFPSRPNKARKGGGSRAAKKIHTVTRTISSDGTFRCSTKIGHGDAMHVGILIKGKGIHVFMPHETASGADCHSPDTCAFTFNATSSMEGLRGSAEWVSPSNTASASCSSQSAGSLYCADGSAGAPSAGDNFLIYWDADESRELLAGTSITKAGGGTLLNATGCSGNNGTRNTPTLTADLLGDWREELMAENAAAHHLACAPISMTSMF